MTRNCLATVLILLVALAACDAPKPHTIESFDSPFGFRLKSATLPIVAESLGPTEEFELPESHNEIGICYTAEDDGPVVVFMSAREFGGEKKLLLGVSIHSENTLDYPCAKSSLRSDDMVLGPIELGASFDEMKAQIAATEVRTWEHVSTFFIERRRELTEEEKEQFAADFDEHEAPSGADTVLGVWGIFENGRATIIGVWMEETY